MIRITAVGLVALLGACATTPPWTEPAAALRTADGRDVGTVQLREDRGGLSVRVAVRGMPPGTHGLHVHAVGRCEAPGFTSAGPHWNPYQRQHGWENPQGAHTGDLPNLVVGTGGVGEVIYRIAGARLTDGPLPLRDADGAALVLHAGGDDYRSDPSGNSGDRIACAVL